MSATIRVGSIEARVWFDDRDPQVQGWYAEYLLGGETIDDSEKAWHAELPTAEDLDDAEREAMLDAVREHAQALSAKHEAE